MHFFQLFLFQPLSFSADISSICLPTSVLASPASKVGLGITVQGWGKDQRGLDGEAGKLLTQIDVSIRSENECNTKYNTTFSFQDQRRIQTQLPELIINSMFCADSNLDSSQVGICNGDSGGPAVFRFRWWNDFIWFCFESNFLFQRVETRGKSFYVTWPCEWKLALCDRGISRFLHLFIPSGGM